MVGDFFVMNLPPRNEPLIVTTENDEYEDVAHDGLTFIDILTRAPFEPNNGKVISWRLVPINVPLTVRFVVTQDIFCNGWQNTWSSDGEPESFATYNEADAAIDEFLKCVAEEVEDGDRAHDEIYGREDFQITAFKIKDREKWP